MKNVEELSAIALDTGIGIHKALGPGLLESAYETILAKKLESLGLSVATQVAIDARYEDIVIQRAFRIDILVEHRLVIEVKSIEQLLPVHAKQVLTYLRLSGLPLGLLMNFGQETFMQGFRRLVNNHTDFASSRLRANQKLATGPSA